MLDKCRSRANIIFGEKLSLVPPSFPINSKGSEHISNWLNSVIHTKFHHHYCNSSDTYLNLCGMSLCRKILICITTRQKGLVNLNSTRCFFNRFVSVINATFLSLCTDQYSAYWVTCQVTGWLLACFSKRNVLFLAWQTKIEGGKKNNISSRTHTWQCGVLYLFACVQEHSAVDYTLCIVCLAEMEKKNSIMHHFKIALCKGQMFRMANALCVLLPVRV